MDKKKNQYIFNLKTEQSCFKINAFEKYTFMQLTCKILSLNFSCGQMGVECHQHHLTTKRRKIFLHPMFLPRYKLILDSFLNTLVDCELCGEDETLKENFIEKR